jgi:hypothetical protein
MVVFDKASHTYKDGNDLEYISVTTLLGQQKEYQFNQAEIAEEVSRNVRSKKYYGMNPEAIKEEWRKATIEGTRLHEAIDLWVKQKKTPLKEEREYYAVRQFQKGRFKGTLESERIVWSKNLLLAGTIDLISIQSLPDETIWTIHDIKTSRKIDDNKMEKYMVQIALYKYLLKAVLADMPNFPGLTAIPDRVECGGIVWYPDYYGDAKTVIKYIEYDTKYDSVVSGLLKKRAKAISHDSLDLFS